MRPKLITLGLTILLAACGGGGGGDRAPGVVPGPPPPGGNPPPQPVPPPQPPASIKAADITADDLVTSAMVGVTMASPPAVTFSLTVNGSLRVTDLTRDNLDLTLAELVPQPNFEIDEWQSFIEVTEDPVCRTRADVDISYNNCVIFTAELDPARIPDTALKVLDTFATGKVAVPHATRENSGTLINNADGTWTYTYATDPGDPLSLPHMLRSCIQFDLEAPVDNPCIDFVPADLAALGGAATSLDNTFYAAYRSRQVITEASCNTCHSQVAIHGGGRTAADYCVSCHNPGSIDANSENTVDMAVMTHRLHNARNLPSVGAGTPYVIWGFRNGEHDYSNLSYPQDMRNCTRCHAGQADVDYALAEGLLPPEAVLTADGANWADKPSPAPCLACHEGSEGHVEGRDSCDGCHGPDATRAPVRQAHRLLLEEQGRALALDVESVSDTGPGGRPVITFSATRDGVPVNIKDPDEFTGDIRFRVGWDAATEYLNSGGSQPEISVNAIPDSKALGGNRFEIDTEALGLAAVAADVDTVGLSGAIDEITTEGTAHGPSLDEYYASTAAAATPRRIVVDTARCNNCHRRLTMHAPGGRSVTDNPRACVQCHEPNRASGSANNSTDMSVMIHGLHAADYRETPYRGWNKDRIQYPGDLADCAGCHVGDTQQLPLPLERAPVKDSTSEFTTPIAAACAACHDGSLAQAHMESTGGAIFRGDFDDVEDAVESCEVCHRSGASADIDVVHAR